MVGFQLNMSRPQLAVMLRSAICCTPRPQLERFGVPATVFVTTNCVGSQREFRWDELEGLLLSPGSLPQSLRLGIDGRNHQWHLGAVAAFSEADWQQHRHWKAPDNPPTPRHTLFAELWKLLQPLAENKQRYLLNTLRAWTGATPAVRPSHRALSTEELRSLTQSELVEIGAHIETHTILKGLPVAVQRNEIQNSKSLLEELLARPVTTFAYPYGAYGDDTVALVRQAGFASACSTRWSRLSRPYGRLHGEVQRPPRSVIASEIEKRHSTDSFISAQNQHSCVRRLVQAAGMVDEPNVFQ